MSQLTNEADVQLAEVLVAVSDALVAANQEQSSNEVLEQTNTPSTTQLDQQQQQEAVQILETSEQQGIETDMNADQTVPILGNGENSGNQVRDICCCLGSKTFPVNFPSTRCHFFTAVYSSHFIVAC